MTTKPEKRSTFTPPPVDAEAVAALTDWLTRTARAAWPGAKSVALVVDYGPNPDRPGFNHPSTVVQLHGPGAK